MTRVQSYLSYALFVAVSCGVWWQPLARTFSLALHNDEYTHLLLILPVSATMILLEWKSQRQCRRTFGSVQSCYSWLFCSLVSPIGGRLVWLTMFNFRS